MLLSDSRTSSVHPDLLFSFSFTARESSKSSVLLTCGKLSSSVATRDVSAESASSLSDAIVADCGTVRKIVT